MISEEPDWQVLPAKTPAKIRDLLRQCLQRDWSRRLPSIAEARSRIEQVQHGYNRWRFVAVAATAFAAFAFATALTLQRRTQLPDRSQWLQLTKFPDPVSQPALSPDGRMLAFVRSPSTFFAAGQIYVKSMPDGEPVLLTHDSLKKMSPVFSPGGQRIAYTTVDPKFNWDTWVVPVRGGEAQPWLRNASGLIWIDMNHVLFSEIKEGARMGIVMAENSRTGARDVYMPATTRGMAHRSSLARSKMGTAGGDGSRLAALPGRSG